jgi:predicted PurR-regulated permease PerM
MTTATRVDAQLYRSHRQPENRAAVRAAATIGTVLAGVGVVAMILGVGGTFGLVDLGGPTDAFVIGLGLVGIGAGTLLLVILQAWRVVTDR